jgi:hypothetical protein
MSNPIENNSADIELTPTEITFAIAYDRRSKIARMVGRAA